MASAASGHGGSTWLRGRVCRISRGCSSGARRSSSCNRKNRIRLHPAGFRFLWRWKSRLGRPRIPVWLRDLIRRMARDNPVWGQERIANELWLKLGLRVSPHTVRKYLPRAPDGRPRGNQRQSTFLKNHAEAVVACDFFVAVTSTFRLLYGNRPGIPSLLTPQRISAGGRLASRRAASGRRGCARVSAAAARGCRAGTRRDRDR